MILQSFKDRFILHCEYEDRMVAKGAGFRWSPEIKKWWTNDVSKAMSLINHADDETRKRLLGFKSEQELAIVQSRATNSEIDIPVPEGLSYLPYQKAGIAYSIGKNSALIADEMGLGKTIQAIGISNVVECSSILIICPATLKLNWKQEFEKWSTKNFTVSVGYSGKSFPTSDVVILNYESVKKHRPSIMKRTWDILIVDEAHALKNPKSQRTQAILGKKSKKIEEQISPIKAARRIFLTGTPIVNRPIELWPLVQSLDPDGLGSSWYKFVERYCGGVKTQFGYDTSGSSNLNELQEKCRSRFMIRRLKKDVLTELPPKRRGIVVLDSDGKSIAAVKAENEAYARGQDAIEKAKIAMELAKADSEEAYKLAVSNLRKASGIAFQDMAKERYDVAMAKVPQVLEYVDDLIESEKIILFCHHSDVADQFVGHYGKDCVVVTGKVPIEDRQAQVDRFQNDPSCRVFIGSIGAAGVGITLTASSTVVFAELDWVPGKMSQAEDRAHRLGQNDSVNVTHLVLDGSLDQRMASTIIRKQEVIDAAMDTQGKSDLSMEVSVPSDIAPGTERSSRRDIERESHLITDDQSVAIHKALRILAWADADHARSINGVGFNKIDSAIGRSLALSPGLSKKQAALGKRVLAKYKKQLPSELIELITS